MLKKNFVQQDSTDVTVPASADGTDASDEAVYIEIAKLLMSLTDVLPELETCMA